MPLKISETTRTNTYNFYSVPGGRGEVPDALLVSRIKLGVVGTREVALGPRDGVLAPALLAAVLVRVENEPVVARALVRADRVRAHVLAAAVVGRALVLVWMNSNEKGETDCW